MEYLQYKKEQVLEKWTIQGVLNLIINGIPSIRYVNWADYSCFDERF